MPRAPGRREFGWFMEQKEAGVWGLLGEWGRWKWGGEVRESKAYLAGLRVVEGQGLCPGGPRKPWEDCEHGEQLQSQR